MNKFKVFSRETASDLEKSLNDWAAQLPSGAKIKRTQLAAYSASEPRYGQEAKIIALINYEIPDK